MITLPQSFEESTSSDLSDLESPLPPSKLYMTSLTQQAPSSGEDTPTPNHPMVTRHKYRIKRPQSYDESSSVEDTSTATRPMVSRPEQKGKLARRLTSRTTKRPQSYEESSSSGLSEPESPLQQMEASSCKRSASEQSEFNATSPLQGVPPSMVEALAVIPLVQGWSIKRNHPLLGQEGSILEHHARKHNKIQVESTQRRSAKRTNSCYEDESFMLSHRMTPRDPAQVTQRKSYTPGELLIPTPFQSHPEIEMPLQEYTPTLLRSVPYLQGESNQQEFNVLQMHAINSQKFCAPWQGNSVQQQPFAPQNGICAEERFLPDEQRPAISDLNNIDPTLLNLELFPADTVLLNTGRPISIPIWEIRHFRPLSVFHEEPSDLALSEYEGDIDAAITQESTTGSKLVEEMKATKYVYQIRDVEERKWKPRLRYGHRNFTRSRGSASKPKRIHPPNKYSLPDSSNSPIKKHRHLKGSTPIEVGSPKTARTTMKKRRSTKQGKFADEQTRFIILMRIYWDLPFNKLTEAFNREFEKSWSITTIRTRFDATLDEPKFDEYRKALVKARDGSHKPEGLDERLLLEAKGFLNRLEH